MICEVRCTMYEVQSTMGKRFSFIWKVMKNVQYIINEKGKKIAVVVPVNEYEKLLFAAEELEDIVLYDRVKAKNEPSIKLSDYLKERKARGQ